ncbi:MAG: ATP-binding protein [Ramlibacter sp.]
MASSSDERRQGQKGIAIKYEIGMRAVLAVLVLTLMAPVSLLAIRISSSDREGALEKARASLLKRVELRGTAQARFFESTHFALTAIAQAVATREPNVTTCREFLRRIDEQFPNYADLGFADRDGNLVCRSDSDHGKISVADRPYFFDAARTRQFTVSGHIASPLHGAPAVAFGLPVYLPDGRFRGIQYAVVNLSNFGKFLALSAQPGVADFITDTSGTILAAGGEAARQAGERLPGGFLLRKLTQPDTVGGTGVDDHGNEWLYASKFVAPEAGSGGMVVISMMSAESVLVPVRVRLHRMLLVLLLLATGATIVAWRMGDRLLAAPTERLLRKIRALEREGPGAARPPGARPPSIRELRRIDHGIDRLALALAIRESEWDCAVAELQQQKTSLEITERRYRAQFEASPQPMWVFDANTLEFLVVNDAAVAHYGYSREEFAKMTLADIHSAADIPLALTDCEKTDSGPPDALCGRHRRKSGDIICVEVATHALDWDGHPALVAIIYDVTSRETAKQAWKHLNQTLEEKVAQRTRELELANEDLEAFSSSVSHDLRGPLHIIDGFCAALLEKHGEALPAQANQYLEQIRTGTQQMNALITDLLSFAKTGREPLLLQQSDLAPLAAHVVSRLRQRFPQRQVSVHIEEPLPARCDPRLLAIVLENLIGNAWKFTARTPRATIRVGRHATADTEDTYVVSDNGAGFDRAHAGKLFKPFQRLHSAREFEGTGIGLATVYRIICRHGGRVWAESAVGAGASFYFSLP